MVRDHADAIAEAAGWIAADILTAQRVLGAASTRWSVPIPNHVDFVVEVLADEQRRYTRAWRMDVATAVLAARDAAR